jgi:hypothetical protein
MSTIDKSLDDLYLGKINNSLKSHITYNTTVSNISSAITKLPNYQELKQGASVDAELVNVICNIVEQHVSNNKSQKIDKKKLVVDAITAVFPLKPDEITTLMNHIEYLFNNNCIKRFGIFQKIYKKAKKIRNYLLL